MYKDLIDFQEQDGLVYSLDGFYATEDMVDMLKLKYPDIEFESAEIEITPSMASRRNVGTILSEAKPYLFSAPSLDGCQFDGARLLSDIGFLPDSNDVYFKEVLIQSIDINNLPETVIYSQELHKYFLINNLPFKVLDSDGDHLLVKVQSMEEAIWIKPYFVKNGNQHSITSTDVSAQEPVFFSLLSREKNWMEIFELKNFKMDDYKLLSFIEVFFKDHLKIDPETDDRYRWFIHDTFFYDRTLIYKINNATNSLRAGDESKRDTLKKHLSELENLFTEYVNTSPRFK